MTESDDLEKLREIAFDLAQTAAVYRQMCADLVDVATMQSQVVVELITLTHELIDEVNLVKPRVLQSSHNH